MQWPKFVNSIGLVLDLVGVLIIFKYGLPGEISRAGNIFLTAGVSEEEQIEAEKYDFRAKIGLWMIASGFLLQLVSNWLPL